MPSLIAISGFDAKGPACFLLHIAGRRFLLDLGTGPDAGRMPDLAGVGHVDAVLISHGHPDHIGALSLLGRIGLPPVFATAPVTALSPAVRAVSGGLLPARGAVLGVPIETGPSGHAPGAVWMRVGGEDGLLYTGDLSVEGSLWPCVTPPRARAAVLDASYGAADEALPDQRAAVLALAAEGPLLLPAPAAGRGLEMARVFLEAGHEVFLCPAHRRVAAVMQAFPGWLAPGGAAALAQLLAATRPLAPEAPARGVMIAAGPNAEGGVAAVLAARFAETGAARIVFTGHLGLETPAEALTRTGRAAFLRWNVHPPLATTRALLDAIAPAQAMAAFTPAAGRRALAAALPGAPLAETAELHW